jgi:site-specific recombinase XerD
MATAALVRVDTRQEIATATIGEEFLAGQLSERTVRAYRSDVQDFFGKPCEDVTAEDLRMVTPGHVLAWRNARMQEQAASTVARKLSSLRSLFRYAEAVGMIATSPVKREVVRSPKVTQESSTEGLDREEARALLEAIDGEDLTALRDRALVELAIRTGLRRAEIIGANVADLGRENGHHVLTVTGKGGTRQTVKVPVPAARALEAYLAARTDASPALFVSHARNGHEGKRLSAQTVYDRVKRYAEAAGIAKNITPHSLRHTFVTLSLDGGATVRQVQAAARHADPKTTLRYDRHRRNLDDHASDYLHF